MRRPQGPASIADAATVGKYWKSLLTNQSWLLRRVETGTILDESHVDIRVSMDLDTAELRARLPETQASDDLAPIPLASLRKELQLDLDVLGPHGEPLSIAVSDTDAHFSHAYLLREIADRNIQLGQLTPRFMSQSYTVLRSANGLDDLVEIILAVDDYQVGSDEGRTRLGMSAKDAESWSLVLDDDELFELMLDLSVAYFMIAYVPTSADSTIIKYRRLAEAEVQGSRLGAMSLGLKPLSIHLNANGIGMAMREHTRVTAPPDTRVVGGTLLAAGAPVDPRRYEKRTDADRIVFYTTKVPPADYSLRIEVTPRLISFFLPALVCAVITLLFALAALYLEGTSERFTRSVVVDGQVVIANADASVALLALVPTLFAVFLVQGGEHRLVARLHAAPRVLLLVSALLLLLCAGCIAVSAGHTTLMTALWPTVVTAAISATYFLAVIATAGVRQLTGPVKAFWRALRTAD